MSAAKLKQFPGEWSSLRGGLEIDLPFSIKPHTSSSTHNLTHTHTHTQYIFPGGLLVSVCCLYMCFITHPFLTSDCESIRCVCSCVCVIIGRKFVCVCACVCVCVKQYKSCQVYLAQSPLMGSPQWLQGSRPHYIQVRHTGPAVWELIGVKVLVWSDCALCGWYNLCVCVRERA